MEHLTFDNMAQKYCESQDTTIPDHPISPNGLPSQMSTVEGYITTEDVIK